MRALRQARAHRGMARALVGVAVLVLQFGPIPARGANGPEGIEPDPHSTDPVARGAYVAAAAGCQGCHTDNEGDGTPYAGGRALETSFGTFVSPNITPHPDHGIGAWDLDDFTAALREGRSPDGHAYFPAFPYNHYTRMVDDDIADLKAFLDALEPVDQPDRPHDLMPPFGWRWLLPVWRLVYIEDFGPMETDPDRSEPWNRGAYLVEGLGHCAACHTPRDFLGGYRVSMHLAGTKSDPQGRRVPNITPDDATGIGDWSHGDMMTLLDLGMLPDGDFVGNGMDEVVNLGTALLTEEDREAIADYLLTVEPVHHDVSGN